MSVTNAHPPRDADSTLQNTFAHVSYFGAFLTLNCFLTQFRYTRSHFVSSQQPIFLSTGDKWLREEEKRSHFPTGARERDEDAQSKCNIHIRCMVVPPAGSPWTLFLCKFSERSPVAVRCNYCIDVSGVAKQELCGPARLKGNPTGSRSSPQPEIKRLEV